MHRAGPWPGLAAQNGQERASVPRRQGEPDRSSQAAQADEQQDPAKAAAPLNARGKRLDIRHQHAARRRLQHAKLLKTVDATPQQPRARHLNWIDAHATAQLEGIEYRLIGPRTAQDADRGRQGDQR